MSVYQYGNQDLDLAVAYDDAERELYIGEAKPGTADSGNGWRIYRLAYVGATTCIAKRRYANGSSEFDKVWDDRATYDYTD